MSGAYDILLEATIEHLEQLKSEGGKFVSVSPDVLEALQRPAPRPAARQAEAPAPRQQAPAPAPTSAPSRMRETAPAPQPTAAPATISPTDRQGRIQAMEDLRQRALACQKCPHLVRSRRNVVFGVGDIFADLMFIGEAPGADEDQQGEPFVGKAGQLLTKIIQTMGLSRDTVYIGNILKCRPDTPGKTYGNRKPTPDEMDTCKPYVLNQVDLIQPKAIVALGATALQGLFGETSGIMRERGNWRELRGIPVLPTFHPSYVLRQGDRQTKRLIWEDMLQVMERLQMPITDKQRGFFK